jgi:hypothetical protein
VGWPSIGVVRSAFPVKWSQALPQVIAMFPFDVFEFDWQIQPIVVAAIAVWSLALYLALSKLNDWLMAQLVRWFNYAERSMYTSVEEFDRTKDARASQNSFYASIFSIIPFLGLGCLVVYLLVLVLDQTWAFSAGVVGAIGAAIYELGRRTGED